MFKLSAKQPRLSYKGAIIVEQQKEEDLLAIPQGS